MQFTECYTQSVNSLLFDDIKTGVFYGQHSGINLAEISTTNLTHRFALLFSLKIPLQIICRN